MKIVRSINLEAARHHGPKGFLEITVATRDQARERAREMVPMPLHRQAVIYIQEENLIAHLGALEGKQEVRCWNVIADGQAVIFPRKLAYFVKGELLLGHPDGCDGAPLLFPEEGKE